MGLGPSTWPRFGPLRTPSSRATTRRSIARSATGATVSKTLCRTSSPTHYCAISKRNYMIDIAPTIEDFRRLLARQVRRRLARRRTRTVVDNLIDRSRPLLASAPFVRHQRHQATTYGLTGADTETRAATFPELRAAADAIRSLPQRGHIGGERAPIVFSTVVLTEALRRVAESLPVAFTIGELDRILRLALPHFLPSVLDSDDAFTEHTPINRAAVRRCVGDLRVRLDDEGRVVLGMKLAGASDREVGAALGVSRRTAVNRKARVYGALEDVLGPLSHGERLATIDQLRPEIQVSLRQVRLGT